MSENFREKRKNPFEPIVSPIIEEIALHAAEMQEFKDCVTNTSNRMELIRLIREKLPKHFPEISSIPPPRPGEHQKEIAGLPSNDFLIAKAVIDLLQEKK